MIRKIYDKGLPRLAWIAVINKETLAVTVMHGQDVEMGPDFIVEGVWDGDFESGHFHTSDHFFGSGLRREEGNVLIVPSTALVDRILLADCQRYYFASNSLVCLMAYLDAKLDPENNYKKQSDAILSGVDKYDPSFPVIHNEIKELKQIFYYPIEITKQGAKQLKRTSTTIADNYWDYHRKLKDSLLAISENSMHLKREKPLVAYTTISRGYDSTATSALTRDLNIRKAFTSRRSSSGIAAWISPNAAIDDGTDMAQKLGLEVSYLDYKQDEIGEEERLFLCPSPAEPELAFYKAYLEIKDNNQPALLFTGHYGDKVWSKSLDEKYLDSGIIRGDTAGLNLSEARLDAGFIHAPVPFMYAAQIKTINRISNSKTLSPWSVPGDYDRPIPRRIAEDQGMHRADFGTRKKAVISFYNEPKNKKLNDSFRDHLNQNFNISGIKIIYHNLTDKAKFIIKKVIYNASSLVGLSTQQALTKSTLDLPYKMHFWALTKQIEFQRARLTYKEINSTQNIK